MKQTTKEILRDIEQVRASLKRIDDSLIAITATIKEGDPEPPPPPDPPPGG